MYDTDFTARIFTKLPEETALSEHSANILVGSQILDDCITDTS